MTSTTSQRKAKADPIFAAIEKHREAEAKYGAAIGDFDAYQGEGPELQKLERRQRQLCNVDCRAVRELCTTVPTTLAGTVAALRYFEAQDEETLDLPIGSKGSCGRAFLLSLRKAIETFAA